MTTLKEKLVFLDAATVDLGDLDMRPLTSQGRYRAYANSSQSQVVQRARDAEIIITNKCLLREKELSCLPRLRLICLSATGVNNVDLLAAKRLHIGVANVPDYSTTTVAEHTLMFLLALAHRLGPHHTASTSGAWSWSGSFALLDFPYSDLAGKILGVIGYGAIGREVARLARAFRVKILIARLPGRTYGPAPKRVPLNQLLRQSDFVTIHCPLTPLTRHLIRASSLRLMKPTAFLLNLARGPIVCDEDVALFLKKGRLAGYAADVLAQEPPPRSHPFFKKGIREKVLLTPHIAWASRESRQRLIDEIGKNIAAFKKGLRRNRMV